jgi:hypothetical protein
MDSIGLSTANFRDFENSLKNKLHTCIPVEVVAISVDARVDVKAIYDSWKIGITRQVVLDTGEYVMVDDYEAPIIADCPIVMMINSNARITMPIEIGDTGLLVISEKDITNWKDNQGTQLSSLRRFNLNDGFFIPFINQTISNYLTNAIEIDYKGNKIKITNSLIEIIGDAKITGDLEITGDLKVDGKATITGEATISGIAFSTHVHTSAAPGSPTSPPIP